MSLVKRKPRLSKAEQETPKATPKPPKAKSKPKKAAEPLPPPPEPSKPPESADPPPFSPDTMLSTPPDAPGTPLPIPRDETYNLQSPPIPPPPPKMPAVYNRKDYTQYSAVAMTHRDSYIESLCESDELQKALAHTENPRAHEFLRRINNPAYRRQKISLANIAFQCGLTPVELADIWKDYHLASATFEMLKKAPEVARDIVEDAKSGRVCCARCDGYGKIRFDEEVEDQNTHEMRTIKVLQICPQCEGKGWTRKEGSDKARNIMMEAIGVVKRGGGVVVNVDNRKVEVGESVIEQLEKAERAVQDSESVVIDIDAQEAPS